MIGPVKKGRLIMRKQAKSIGQGSFGILLKQPSGFEGNLAQWICRIQAVCAREVNNVLELARLVAQARHTLPRGGWSKLWETGAIPFSKRKGEMLVTIGECVEGLTAQNSAQLPAAWNTLYYLARLGREAMEQLIGQGRIHPGLSLEEAKALSFECFQGKPRTNPRSKLHLRLSRFAAFVQANLGIWSQEERTAVVTKLAELTWKIQSVRETGKEIAELRQDQPCQFLLPRVRPNSQVRFDSLFQYSYPYENSI
jgi:hypothetical protein